MAVSGRFKPDNLVHVVINNGSHETVGGMPTVMNNLSIHEIARSCGYPYSVVIGDHDKLDRELILAVDRRVLSLIEVKCNLDSRNNLGRPTLTTLENKKNFMRFINS